MKLCNIFEIDLLTIDWTSLATIGTLITLIVIILTLKETIKSRKYSYHPYICIPEANYKIEKDKRGLPNVWTRMPDQHNTNFPPLVDMYILNVGLAAALDVKITWMFDIDAMENKIDSTIERGTSRLYKANTNHGGQYFFEDNVPIKYGFIIKEGEVSENFSVINKESAAEMRIPKEIINYISYYRYEVFRQKDINRESVDLEIPVSIKLEYSDIENNIIKRRFSCFIEIINYSDKDKSTGTIALVKFKIVEKKKK